MTKRVIAILGDYYHQKELAKQSLTLAEEQVNDVVVEHTSVDKLIESLQTQPDAVILYAENRINPQDDEVKTWMDADAANEIRRYVNEGGKWIGWHSGLASFENIEEYTSLLRGYFKYHPEKHQMVTYFSEEDTAFFTKEDTFEILDEHYFVDCDVQNTTVFLKSKSIDGDSIAGWHHDFGKGHVICITPAHNKEGLLHPNMTKILINTLKKI